MKRREVFLTSTKNIVVANEPALSLHSDDMAVKYITGWIVMKLNSTLAKVVQQQGLQQAVKALTGPMMPNTSNYAYMSEALKRSSLHSGVPQLEQYIKELSFECTTHMTGAALFIGRQHSFTHALKKVEGNPWLWKFWQRKLCEAGVRVEPAAAGSSPKSAPVSVAAAVRIRDHLVAQPTEDAEGNINTNNPAAAPRTPSVNQVTSAVSNPDPAPGARAQPVHQATRPTCDSAAAAGATAGDHNDDAEDDFGQRTQRREQPRAPSVSKVTSSVSELDPAPLAQPVRQATGQTGQTCSSVAVIYPPSVVSWKLISYELETLLSRNTNLPPPQAVVFFHDRKQLESAFGNPKAQLFPAVRAVDNKTGRCSVVLSDAVHFRAMFGFSQVWCLFDSLNMFQGFDLAKGILNKVYPHHRFVEIPLRPQADVVQCSLWVEWAVSVFSNCTDEQALAFQDHLVAEAAKVNVKDLGPHPCTLAGSPQALANTEFILSRKAAFRGSESRPGPIYRTEAPEVELARRAPAEGGTGGSSSEPIVLGGGYEAGMDGGLSEGMEASHQTSAHLCVITHAQARVLQGLVCVKYLRMRMRQEIQRAKATPAMENQTFREGLKSNPAKRKMQTEGVPGAGTRRRVEQKAAAGASAQSGRCGSGSPGRVTKESNEESKEEVAQGSTYASVGSQNSAAASVCSREMLLKMKVPELKNEAKQRGVKHSSLRKEELLARLLELYDQELA